MSMQVTFVQSQEMVSVFAKLYGLGEQDTLAMTSQMTSAWMVHNQDLEVLGAIGLRPSPVHGAEVMGGAFEGIGQQQAALMLIQAALSVQPQLYAYAEEQFLPDIALATAGLEPMASYIRMAGPIPPTLPEVLNGFRLIRWAEAGLEDRLAAQRTYSDRIGHTYVTAEAVELGEKTTDDALSRLAYDALGKPAGVCRASLNGETLELGTPGVRPDLRHTELRRALLLSVCQAARALGATQIILEGWGDTHAEQLDDKALGLGLEEQVFIYASTLLSD